MKRCIIEEAYQEQLNRTELQFNFAL